MAARSQIQKISARVFCQADGSGGNPVTIFAAPWSFPKTLQEQLAQSCSWESVMVDTKTNRLGFYMPTGERVSFCAHAAMAGITKLKETASIGTERQVSFTSLPAKDDTNTDRYYGEVRLEHDTTFVSLHMETKYSEVKVPHPPMLRRVLHDACGLTTAQLSTEQPTFVNASVARPKTLVRLQSVEDLHRCRVPTSGNAFKNTCDALNSTGIYLFSIAGDEQIECRQFPRASGYPEDPATGIAAGALAIALRKTMGNNYHFESFRFYQGRDMGQGSVLLVEQIRIDDEDEVSFSLMGKVQEDSRESIDDL